MLVVAGNFKKKNAGEERVLKSLKLIMILIQIINAVTKIKIKTMKAKSKA